MPLKLHVSSVMVDVTTELTHIEYIAAVVRYCDEICNAVERLLLSHTVNPLTPTDAIWVQL